MYVDFDFNDGFWMYFVGTKLCPPAAWSVSMVQRVGPVASFVPELLQYETVQQQATCTDYACIP